MLPISNRGLGMNIGFPDVCLTPAAPAPIPVPYPNIAMNAQAAPFAVKTMVRMMNVINMGSKIPMTMGDEPGVAHPFFKQMGSYTMGNPRVLVEMLPAITLTMPTTGNMMNNAAGLVAVPSVVHVFLSQRDAAPAVDELPRLTRQSEVSLRRLPRQGDVVVLTIPRFGRDLPARVHALLADREAAPAGIVVDLRGCPGGELAAAIELAGDFLPEGKHVATVVDPDGDETPYARRHPIAYRQAVAILVDGDTASAAELFAASLQRHGRAVVLGHPTHGKDVVQSVAGLRDEDHAYLADCARWRVGTDRSVPVIPERILEAGEDALDAALAVLSAPPSPAGSGAA